MSAPRAIRGCPCCDKPLCASCGRCPASGHTELCQSDAAQQARAWIAALKERVVGSLLEIIMREEL